MMRSRLTLKVKVKGHVHEVNKYGNPGACIDSHYELYRALCNNIFHVANLYLLPTVVLA